MVCIACDFEHTVPQSNSADPADPTDSDDTNSDDDILWPTMSSSEFVADGLDGVIWRSKVT